MAGPDATAFAQSARRSRAAARDWRDGAALRRVAATFADADPADPDQLAQVAIRLLAAPDWVAGLIDPLVAALAADPWFEPPFRTSRDELRTSAILFDSPAVMLTASILSAAALERQPPARTIVAPGRLTIVHYLRGGGARLRRWAVPTLPEPITAATMGECVALPDRLLADGETLRFDGRVGAQLVEDAASDVVTLSATIRAGQAPVMREYDRASGGFVRLATNDEGAARSQALLTVLRVARAGDANGCFEAASRDDAFFLRWSAMREWLALDWRAAQPRLVAMAEDDSHPEVRAAARATLAQLEERRAA